MISTSKKLHNTKIQSEGVHLSGRGKYNTDGPKNLYLQSEELPAKMPDGKVGMFQIAEELNQAEAQAIIDNHDYDAAVIEEAETAIDLQDSPHMQRFDKAIWISYLDVLREQCGATETNAQFRQRVKDTYQGLPE